MLTTLALIVQLVNIVCPLDNKLNQRANPVHWVNTARRLDGPRAVTIAGQANTTTRIFKYKKLAVNIVAMGNTTVKLLALLLQIVKLVLPENTTTRTFKPAANRALQENIMVKRVN